MAVEFERAIQHTDRPMPVSRAVIRAGLKSLWRQARYDRIVKEVRSLPDDLIQHDDTVLMYFTCALTRLTENTALGKGAA